MNLKKLFDENKFLHRYLFNTKYIQKYLTQEEIAEIKTFPGKTLLEKMWNMRNNATEVKYCDECHCKVPFNNWFVGGYGRCPKCGKDYSEVVIPSKKSVKPYYITDKVKRRVIEVLGYDFDALYRFRNDNVKFHFKCKKCNKDVITSYTTISHTKDWLCKACRKLSKE